MKRILLPLLIAVLGFCNPSPASAQTKPAPQEAVAVPEAPTAETLREELREIMRLYPYTVGEILRRDPSLMAKPDYMAPYPKLVEFLNAHPEAARNVEYYFEGYGSWGERRNVDPNFEALGVLLGGMAGVFIVITLLGVLTWLVKSFIQHRRWLKASQLQADVHTKLMERMSTNEELLHYIGSAAGRRFLEAAPVRADIESPAISAPVGSIIWSMMAGIVLAVVGAGFRYSASFVGGNDDSHQAFVVVGVIILSLGIGFILASLMAFAVSSRLGLFPQKAAPQESESGHA